MARSNQGGKLDELAKLLDEIDVGNLTLDDVKSVKHPLLAQTLKSMVSPGGPVTDIAHHCSHLVHVSHGSTMLQ